MFPFKKEKPFPPTPTPTTAKRWFSNADGVAELRDLVNQPIFRLAAATLKDGARPRRMGLADHSANSISLAWYAGYCDAFRDLNNLTKTPKQLTRPDEDEWAYVQRPE